MNSNNAPALIRTLIIYGTCIPLAIWIGYLVTQYSYDRNVFGYAGILTLIFLTPILLRWHHFLLIAGWNFGMTIFFLPGSPPVWLLLTAISLGISLVHRTINSRAHFLSAPQVTWPLVFFFFVVIVTAKLTGGIGLHSLGSEVSGGKNYFTLLFGILGYFALTAVRVPPERAGLYIGLFFLAGCSDAIGDLAAYVPSKLYFIFAFFPAHGYNMETTPGMIDFHARYSGFGFLGMSGFLFMLARYGLRGIFLAGKPWRWVLLGTFFVCIFLGGFRSHLLQCGLTFTLMFFMERMYRTNVMPLFLFGGLLGVALLIPFANKLPYTFQRTLAFLPLKLERAARMDAEGSSDWRLEIWRDTYPKVPKYLLLGKGYAISQEDLHIVTTKGFNNKSVEDTVTISQTYHSGPLSVLIPFGAWGAIALIWLWIGGLRVLYANYHYGDAAFRGINIFLFAYFIVKIFHFLVIFGGIENDVAEFGALVGLSVSINGGVRRPVPVQAPRVEKNATNPMARPRFQPFYSR